MSSRIPLLSLDRPDTACLVSLVFLTCISGAHPLHLPAFAHQTRPGQIPPSFGSFCSFCSLESLLLCARDYWGERDTDA